MSYTRRQIHHMCRCIGAGIRGINSTTSPNVMVLIVKGSPENYRDCETDGVNRIDYVGTGSVARGHQKMNGDNVKLRDFRGVNMVFRKRAVNDYEFLGLYKRLNHYNEVVNDGRKVFLFPIVKCNSHEQ